MIDCLMNCGIKEKTVNTLYSTLSEGTIYSLSCNEYEIIEIIKYFKEIGIIDIDQLLLSKTGLFIESFRKIKNLFTNRDIRKTVEMVNSDIDYIDEL